MLRRAHAGKGRNGGEDDSQRSAAAGSKSKREGAGIPLRGAVEPLLHLARSAAKRRNTGKGREHSTQDTKDKRGDEHDHALSVSVNALRDTRIAAKEMMT